MRKVEIQKKVCIELLTPENVFESGRQFDQDLDTPLQSEFKLYISGRFPDLKNRTGRSKNFTVNTYFNESIKPIQVKGKCILIHLLSKLKLCIDHLLRDGHIEKLSRCSEYCFISPIVITAKRGGSIKLALNSKLLNKQIFRNRYQMLNLFELIHNVAVKISGHDENKIWFSSIDLKYAYSQIPLSGKASNQCNFIIVGEMSKAHVVLKLDFTDYAICLMNFNVSWTV